MPRTRLPWLRETGLQRPSHSLTLVEERQSASSKAIDSTSRASTPRAPTAVPGSRGGATNSTPTSSPSPFLECAWSNPVETEGSDESSRSHTNENVVHDGVAEASPCRPCEFHCRNHDDHREQNNVAEPGPVQQQ